MTQDAFFRRLQVGQLDLVGDFAGDALSLRGAGDLLGNPRSGDYFYDETDYAGTQTIVTGTGYASASTANFGWNPPQFEEIRGSSFTPVTTYDNFLALQVAADAKAVGGQMIFDLVTSTLPRSLVIVPRLISFDTLSGPRTVGNYFFGAPYILPAGSLAGFRYGQIPFVLPMRTGFPYVMVSLQVRQGDPGDSVVLDSFGGLTIVRLA